MTELSLGTGYEILPGLKIGAAYRMAFLNATLNSQAVVPATEVISIQTSGISQTRWSGLRVGLQYAPKDANWGVGVTYRNQIRFNANGTTNVLTATSGTSAPTAAAALQNQQTIVSATLPQQFNLAAHYIFMPSWTGFLGYTFTNYSVDQALGFSGVNLGTGPENSDIPLVWNNMHNIRAAVEYDGIQDWALRAGYVWTSQVTPAQNALPIIASPGTGNTVVAGAGHKITSNLTGDAAFEYSWDSGSVPTSPAPASTTAAGDYTAHAYALHLGLTYTM